MFYSVWNLEAKFDYNYTIESDLKLLNGDIIKLEKSLFLVKNQDKTENFLKGDLSYIGNLFEPRTMEFINFFNSYWYSRYFKTFNLYIKDPSYLLKLQLPQIKRAKTNKRNGTYISEYKNFKTYKDYLKMGDENIKIIDYKDFENMKLGKGQNLFIFPDLRSINTFTEKINFKHTIINSSSTNLSKIKKFLNIKLGKEKNIITTSSGIFQDRKKLESIFLFDPYKWYYKNQQNPRYYIPDVVKQIKFFYDVPNLTFVVC